MILPKITTQRKKYSGIGGKGIRHFRAIIVAIVVRQKAELNCGATPHPMEL